MKIWKEVIVNTKLKVMISQKNKGGEYYQPREQRGVLKFQGDCKLL